MIDAYRAGISGNGKPFPDGSKIAKIEWKPKKSTESPFSLKREDVGIDGGLRVVAPLQFFQHALPRSSHRNLLPMTDKAIAAASFSLRDASSAALAA